MAKLFFLRPAVLACVVLLVPGAAFAQTKSSDFWLSPAQCSFVLSLHGPKLSNAEKACYFRSQMFGRSAYLTVSFWSGVGMLKHQVQPWPDGANGFADQLGMRYSRVLAKNTAEFLAGGFTGEDPRFRSSLSPDQSCKGNGASGKAGRIAHSLLRVVWTENDGTCAHQLAYGRFAGAFGSSLMEREWLPGRENTWDRTMRSTSVSLASYAARSVWDEFAPDIKRKLAPHMGRFGSWTKQDPPLASGDTERSLTSR